MSYVPIAEIGCCEPENPYSFLEGPGSMFLHPQSIATSGKSTVPAGATTMVMQGWFADQVKQLGWHKGNTLFYRELRSITYPSNFLPEAYRTGFSENINGTLQQANLGQTYLNNALGWTFIHFPKCSYAYEPLAVNNTCSPMAPVFVDPRATGIGLHNEEELLKPKKYEKLINLALEQAYAAPYMAGPCGKVLIFICNVMTTKYGKRFTESNTNLAKWWKMLSRRN